MKMVKSLLLGSAAGLVAMAGAQAADLPVKAKPVQYVKICSLYGVGFYYIPGTDMCIKMGGWVRAEYAYGDNGNMTRGPVGNGNAKQTAPRATARSVLVATSRLMPATRPNTARFAATSRLVLAPATSVSNTAANQFSANRAFIQWAGFTFGLAQSFFDFYSVPATSYWGIFPASDTGDPGWFTMGYTAQFGNGFSATIAAEERRMTQIISESDAGGTINPGGIRHRRLFALAGINASAGAYGGFQMPGHRRQPARRPGLGFCPDHGCSAPGQCALLRHDRREHAYTWYRPSSDKLGWVVGGGHQAERSDDRPGRLLPGPGQLHRRCAALHLPDPELELGHYGW